MKRDSNDGQLSFDVTVSVLCALVIRSQVDSLFRCCHRRNAETSGKKKKCRRLPRLTPRLRGRVWQWKLPRLTHVTFRKKLTERLRKAKGTKKSRGKADFTKKNVSASTTPLCSSWQCFPSVLKTQRKTHN